MNREDIYKEDTNKRFKTILKSNSNGPMERQATLPSRCLVQPCNSYLASQFLYSSPGKGKKIKEKSINPAL